MAKVIVHCPKNVNQAYCQKVTKVLNLLAMTRFSLLLSFVFLSILATGTPARAQQEFQIPQGGFAGGSAPALDQEGILMLQAMQKAMQGDFKGAEQVYSSILASNDQNMDAHLHRGILRRELKNTSGSQADAKATIQIANNALQQNPRDAEAYHHRGMAFRLLGQYPQALKDIDTSLRLGGEEQWKTDLRDTVLEEKASRGVSQ